MSGRIVVPPLAEERNPAVLPMAYVSGLLDKVEKALLVAERNGDLLLVNSRAKQLLGSYGFSETPGLNLFGDVLLAESKRYLLKSKVARTKWSCKSNEEE